MLLVAIVRYSGDCELVKISIVMRRIPWVLCTFVVEKLNKCGQRSFFLHISNCTFRLF
jgi:hypothetical protein